MPTQSASSPASPCVWSVPRLRAGGLDRSAIRPAFLRSQRSGLAGDGDTGDDLMVAQARKLASGDADDEPVGNNFQQTPQVSAQADQLLVDVDWERTIAP